MNTSQKNNHFFTFCFVLSLFVLCLLFPLKGNTTSFPWDFNELQQSQKQFQVSGKTLNFLNEKVVRHFMAAFVFIQKPNFHINADYIYSFYENHHYIRPFELNIRWKRTDGEWIIGRKLEPWNTDDYFWNRDLWQPVYTNDALRPKWGGLTGIFRTFETPEGKATLFGSFIFIPNRTASFVHKDGKFISYNPWFISPSLKKLGKSNIEPTYVLNKVPLSQFLKLSLAGKFIYKNFYIAYAYKPMHNIKLKSSFVLPLNTPSTHKYTKSFSINTPLDPVIMQHHLVSGGFVIKTKEVSNNSAQSIVYSVKSSFTYNHPEKHILKNTSDIFSQPKKTLDLSAKGEILIQDPLEETILHFAYTHRVQPKDNTNNTLSYILPTLEKQLFWDVFFQFYQATSVGLEHSIKFDTIQKLNIKMRLIYDIPLKYFLANLYGSVTLANQLSVFVSGDFAFSHFPFNLEQTNRDIGVHTNKTRLFGGISYAF